MPLLGNMNLEEYRVLLDDGEELWTEFVLAPDLETAAFKALELSKNRDCTLKDVIRNHEW